MPVNMVIILINFSYSLDSPQTICIGAHNPYNDVKSSLYIVYKKAEIGMEVEKVVAFYFAFIAHFMSIINDLKSKTILNSSHYHGWYTLYKRLQTNQKH